MDEGLVAQVAVGGGGLAVVLGLMLMSGLISAGTAALVAAVRGGRLGRRGRPRRPTAYEVDSTTPRAGGSTPARRTSQSLMPQPSVRSTVVFTETPSIPS